MNMHRSPLTAGLGLLALTLPVAGSPAMANGPEELHLTGVVRDFNSRHHPQGHPDMERQPSLGFGLYTGNVAIELGADRKPVFTGQGARLMQQFEDAEGRPIPPHMFNRRFECQLEYPDDECVDLSHDSPGNQPKSIYRVCFLGAEFNPDGTSTWRYSVTEVQGTNLSHWTLWLDPSIQVMDEGTTPGFYWIGGDHEHFPGPGIKWDMGGGVQPGVFEVRIVGHYYGTMASWVQAKGGGGTSAWEQAPLFGPGTELSTDGTPYKTVWQLVQDPSLGDNPGLFGEPDTGGVQSAETFDQWFRDVPGVNMSRPQTITLKRQADGSYLFDDQEDPEFSELGGFFPINDALFGNTSGWNRNYHFTFELHTKFTYDANAGQFFEFIGDDDVWVFINDQLVIDLGGVHSAMNQYVDLDRLCLQDGGTYRLSFFFAERHTTQSNCRIETNLPLVTIDVPAITAMFD